MAKVIEAKLQDTPNHYPRKFPNPSPHPNTSLLPKPPPSTPFPIRKLSPTEMQARKAKGLCFNCDDKWHHGHKCSGKQFLLLLCDEPDEPPQYSPDTIFPPLPPTPTSLLRTPPATDPPSTPNNPTFFQLFDTASREGQAPRTLRVTGYIQGHIVSVLIDTGRSHNIIQPRLATFLQLLVSPIQAFSVMVGNGDHIKCLGLCPIVALILQ